MTYSKKCVNGDQPDAVRLRRLDAQIRRTYEAYLQSGDSDGDVVVVDGRQLADVCAPVLALVDECPADSVLKRICNTVKGVRLSTWIKVLVVLFIIVGVHSVDWTRVVLSPYGRNTLIRMLPYWDWSQLYYQDCLVRNPYYVHRKLTEDDCQICEVLQESLPRIRNASHSEIAEDYLKSDVPVVVVDALVDWNTETDDDDDGGGGGPFSLKNISKMLLDADQKGSALPCAFASNLRLRGGDGRGNGDSYYRTFLRKLSTEQMESKSWYAHWENCDRILAKALRRHHPRPYFLPPMVDTTEPNWLLVSGAGFGGRSFKQLPILSDMLWLAQVHGSMRIRLTPRHPCNDTCVPIDDNLAFGETLLFTDRMWTFHYLPNHGTVNVAVGGGCSFEL